MANIDIYRIQVLVFIHVNGGKCVDVAFLHHLQKEIAYVFCFMQFV